MYIYCICAYINIYIYSKLHQKKYILIYISKQLRVKKYIYRCSHAIFKYYTYINRKEI